jgi:hypothetical protein
MKKIALLQLAGSEIAILELSNEEHSALHKTHEKFVNDNHVFDAHVRKVRFESDVQAETPATATATTTWTSTIRHWPTCNCSGACVSDVEPT